MPAGGEGGGAEAGSGEDAVADEKDHSFVVGDPVEKGEGRLEIGACTFRLEAEDFADHAQHVAGAFAGGNVTFDAVGVKQEGDFVLVADGGEGEHGGQFGGDIAFEFVAGAEAQGGAHIHDEEDGEFALLAEGFDVGVLGPRGDIPVDAAHVIAGEVFAHFLELHAGAFEGAVVLTGEDRSDDMTGTDFDGPYFPQQLLGKHGGAGNQGTGSSRRMRSRRASASSSSASAS